MKQGLVFRFKLYCRVALPNSPGTFNVTKGMFIVTVQQHGTELQKQYWLPKINNFEVIGAYGQTEIGHGEFYCTCMFDITVSP